MYNPPEVPSFMPCRYVIYQEQRLVITTAWDRVTFAEAKAHQDQLSSDAAFDPEFNQLVDASAVTAIDATIDQIKTIARRGIFSPASRRAFVATSPDIFGLGRMLGTYLEMGRIPQQVQVFYDLPSALEWLGLGKDPRETG
jgi:hypothetical protein